MRLSVVIATHNPDPERLRRTLLGLRAQTFPAADRELVLVNNASTRFPAADFLTECSPPNFSIVTEPELGLNSARRRGFREARGEIAILVDDDNVLAPDYLTQVVALFAAHPQVGAAGGKSLPEFAGAPAEWVREFFPLLALRDLGDVPLIAPSLRPAGSARNEYPAFAPIGAGMAIRREAWQTWLGSITRAAISDRRGSELTSGGDNDIVLTIFDAGWDVAYFPELVLTHLIPATRLDVAYLARLNRGIQKSWMQVLACHGVNPWPPIAAWTVAPRQLKAWFTCRAWQGAAAHVRWQGACGHFEGRSALDP